MQMTVQRIAEAVEGTVRGDETLVIHGLESMDQAGSGDLTFIGADAYARQWDKCHASAALVSQALADSLEPGDGKALIVVDQADLAMARALERFAPPPIELDKGIHASAVVDATAVVDPSACIGPGCVIGPRVKIGAHTRLHAMVCVMQDAVVGNDSEIWPGVVIRERCTLGERCVIHANVTIGADGFGFRVTRPQREGSQEPVIVKIPQIGHVEVGNDVEIGANTAIDRGKFGPTVIGDGCKIDNLVQIGHNCRLGRYVIIAGCCAVGGSVTMGDGVMLGGSCGLKDHIHIGAGATLAAGAQVINDIPAGETWVGAPAYEQREALRQYAGIRKLPDLVKQWRKR